MYLSLLPRLLTFQPLLTCAPLVSAGKTGVLNDVLPEFELEIMPGRVALLLSVCLPALLQWNSASCFNLPCILFFWALQFDFTLSCMLNQTVMNYPLIWLIDLIHDLIGLCWRQKHSKVHASWSVTKTTNAPFFIRMWFVLRAESSAQRKYIISPETETDFRDKGPEETAHSMNHLQWFWL